MRQGLPQGSVLVPLLFLFYINDVESVVPVVVNMLMYADDVTLFTQHREKSCALELLQTAVDHVAE